MIKRFLQKNGRSAGKVRCGHKLIYTKYPNRRCYPDFKHTPRHILAAQELTNWMQTKTLVFGSAEIHKKVTSDDFKGRKGIVFIQNGWAPTGHIDIWNGAAMKVGFSNYFTQGKEVWF